VIAVVIRAMLFQVLAARLMQAIVPSLQNTADLKTVEHLVSELFRVLGTALVTCRNDPTLIYSRMYFSYLTASLL